MGMLQNNSYNWQVQLSGIPFGKDFSEAIGALSVTAANYAEAIAILRGRFGNKQMIINKHIEGLLDMAPVTSKIMI